MPYFFKLSPTYLSKNLPDPPIPTHNFGTYKVGFIMIKTRGGKTSLIRLAGPFNPPL